MHINQSIAKALAYIGLFGSSLWLLGSLLNPKLSFVNAYVSELSVAGQPYASLFHAFDMASAFVVLVAFLLLYVSAVQSAAPRFVRMVYGILTVCSLALVINSFFPMDCAPSQSLACFNNQEAWRITTGQYIHIGGAIVAFGGITITQALSAWHFYTRKLTRPYIWNAANLGLQLIVNGGLLYVCLTGGTVGVGIFQRLSLLFITLWITQVVWSTAKETQP